MAFFLAAAAPSSRMELKSDRVVSLASTLLGKRYQSAKIFFFSFDGVRANTLII